MVQGLGALVTLLGDLSLNPSTHRVAINSIQFQGICHPFLASGGLNVLMCRQKLGQTPKNIKIRK